MTTPESFSNCHNNHLAPNMVEKIRESYQKHSRTISAVSDISVSLAEPLKRDQSAEIRCILLCDSETERNCVFEAISKVLVDGESRIEDVQILQHHWEQPHMDCVGTDCRYCFRVADSHHSSNGGNNILCATTNYSHLEGFFRFSIDGTVFRLMLLSKDRQNLLKIYSFDFLMVGMQVTDNQGLLDDRIWEFEWKRLNRHSKKAVAPIILLGYFRDVLKLGNGVHSDLNLRRPVEEGKSRVQRAGRIHHAIPRFCDFVTGNSVQLQDLFLDTEKLYRHPGFILQQCAHINNVEHFSRVIENPQVTEGDVQYRDNESGDNPIMIAAKMRHKDLVTAVLRSPKFQTNEGNEFLSDLIHTRNGTGQSLLAMVALQGPELEEQKLLILQKEIQIHCVSDLTHEADQLKLQRCLRSQLKSSAEAAIILEQARALQGIPKTERELKAEQGKVWSRLFFASLLLSLIFNAIDTGSDILIMIRYYGEWMGGSSTLFSGTNNTCGEEPTDESSLRQELLSCNSTSGEPISIQCYPQALSAEQKFGYTLFFILVPWPFFIYEFFTSRQYQQLVTKRREIVGEIAQCNGCVSFFKAYVRAIIYSVTFISCFLFWPIAVLFIKYYNDGKYYLAKGAQRAAREKKIEASEVLYATARVMEVSLESSFQPTIQLYILFPVLVRTMTQGTSYSFRIFTICKNENLNMPVFKTDQTISIITSILSLAWCFSLYHATLKRGALDKDLAALFYRLVLFLSILFQIIGRLFIMVLFAYSFGPGYYFPVLVFLAAHILLMTALHFIFSDAKMYWEKGGVLNLSFFHYMVGNGLANIYIHNWIKMDPLLIQFAKPLQHVSTLMRQLVFDIVFASENVILLTIALNSNIKELQDNRLSFAVVLLGFTFLGLVLKCVYYRYLHIWAWLIMDYITTREDGHWKCILFSNMYVCGELKERELLLCCVPKPIFKLMEFFCGERPGSSCTLCGLFTSILILPLVICVGLILLVLALAVMIIFMPFFIVIVLPCVIFVQCREMVGRNNNVVKIVDSDSKHEDLMSMEKLVKNNGAAADLVNEAGSGDDKTQETKTEDSEIILNSHNLSSDLTDKSLTTSV